MKLNKETSDIPGASKIDFDFNFKTEELLGDLLDLEGWSDLKGPRKTWALIPFGNTGFANPARSKALLSKRPQLSVFFDQFPGNVKHAVYSMIGPNDSIAPHQDTYKPTGEKRPKFEIFNTTYRFHIPLITNPQSFFYQNGYFYSMKKGELWMVNNHKIHGAINNHKAAERYHLIFDVEPNEQTMALLENSDSSLGLKKPKLEKVLHSRYG